MESGGGSTRLERREHEIRLCLPKTPSDLKTQGFRPFVRSWAKRMGADVVPNFEKMDVIAEIKRLTDGKGVDVAIKALGTQNTFENALRALRAGGTLSSLGVYPGKLS